MLDIMHSIKPVKGSKAFLDSFNEAAMPPGSLGLLEDLAGRVAAAQGRDDPDISKKAVLVFCADSETAKRTSAWPSSLTASLAAHARDSKACVCAMAKVANAEVFAIDVGMFSEIDGIVSLKPARGSKDITVGPAMTHGELMKAIHAGIAAAQNLAGFGLVAIGEIGIGNTAATSAIASALLEISPRKTTGRGAGLDGNGVERKVLAIEQALRINNPDSSDPLDAIRKVGSFDIAAMAGAYLGCASNSIPAVADGFPSLVAALCAVRLCENALGYIIPSHSGAEPGIKHVLEALGFSPAIDAKMRLGEGTGAVALFPLLDMAMAVKNFAAKRSELFP